MNSCHSNNHPVGERFVASDGTEFLFKPDFSGIVQVTFRDRKFALLAADLKELILEKMNPELLGLKEIVKAEVENGRSNFIRAAAAVE